MTKPDTQTNDTPPQVTIQEGAQAQTVTVQRPDGETLLAGKFKTQEDLIKGYEELSKKLGSQPAADGTPASGEEAAPESGTEDGTQSGEAGGRDGEGDAASGNEPEPSSYGAAVDEALKSADLTSADLKAEFEKDGKFSDASYDALGKAGFPREMVDAYVRGLEASASADGDKSAADVATIKAAAGGDDAFAELQKFVAKLDATEIEAFNTEVTSGDVSRATAAVQAMAAQKLSANGREARLEGGREAGAPAGYATEADYIADVKDPKYKTSQSFRDQVAAKLLASPDLYATR